MTTYEMQQEILRIKQEKNICILVHAYQSHDIWEVADFVGDSFGLCKNAAKSDAETVLMCGVRFMAETAKILCPKKKVLLSHPDAGCPMAEQFDKDAILAMKQKMPGCKVVAYINTTAELKTVCDLCVTSSSAVGLVKSLPDENILFIPDCNLGAFVQQQVPEKHIELVHGGCPVHAAVSVREVEEAKQKHPDALLLVHPECVPAVTAQADFVGSTTEIMAFAKKRDAHEFIIGTENSIVQHLQFDCPDKEFYPLSKGCICKNMKLTTLSDVYRCVCGTGGEEIILSAEVMAGARRCIDNMLR